MRLPWACLILIKIFILFLYIKIVTIATNISSLRKYVGRSLVSRYQIVIFINNLLFCRSDEWQGCQKPGILKNLEKPKTWQLRLKKPERTLNFGNFEENEILNIFYMLNSKILIWHKIFILKIKIYCDHQKLFY